MAKGAASLWRIGGLTCGLMIHTQFEWVKSLVRDPNGNQQVWDIDPKTSGLRERCLEVSKRTRSSALAGLKSVCMQIATVSQLNICGLLASFAWSTDHHHLLMSRVVLQVSFWCLFSCSLCFQNFPWLKTLMWHLRLVWSWFFFLQSSCIYEYTYCTCKLSWHTNSQLSLHSFVVLWYGNQPTWRKMPLKAPWFPTTSRCTRLRRRCLRASGQIFESECYVLS